MFSYEFYKVLHLLSIILFAAFLGYSFAPITPSKKVKIFTGVLGLLIFVAGMGLLARLGIGHGGMSWPGWIIAKVALWLLLTVSTPILIKRLQGPAKRRAFFGVMVVFGLLVYLGVYRPF